MLKRLDWSLGMLREAEHAWVDPVALSKLLSVWSGTVLWALQILRE